MRREVLDIGEVAYTSLLLEHEPYFSLALFLRVICGNQC
jgi:hypothetical protein